MEKGVGRFPLEEVGLNVLKEEGCGVERSLSSSGMCEVFDLCDSDDDEHTLLPFLFDQSCATSKKHK